MKQIGLALSVQRTFNDHFNHRPLWTLLVIAALVVHCGCATSGMAWVRTDGKRIVDEPALLTQGQTERTKLLMTIR
jgi:hypothetical protein